MLQFDDLDLDIKSTKKQSKTLIIIMGASGLLLAVALCWYIFFFNKSVKPATKVEEIVSVNNIQTNYFKLRDEFIVKLKSNDAKTHYMKIKIVLQHHSSNLNELLQAHEPAIHNNVLDHLDKLTYQDSDDVNMKNKLKKDLKDVVNEVLKSNNVKDPIAEVLFTDFLIE